MVVESRLAIFFNCLAELITSFDPTLNDPTVEIPDITVVVAPIPPITWNLWFTIVVPIPTEFNSVSEYMRLLFTSIPFLTI